MWLSSLSLLFILVGCTCSAFNRNLRYKAVRNTHDSLIYLNKFGYNPCSNSSKKFACSVDDSSMLRDYQKRHGLKVTGALDTYTMRQMNQPRCGNADVRAARSGEWKWSRSSLTWSLRSHPQQISTARATAIVGEAFNAWLAHIPLQVTKTCATCPADFVLEIGRYDHNCPGGAFDGPSGTLAHAFFPENGRIHFDADESWTEAFDNSDINFYLVAVHEIGHALGLDHNDNRGSIMYPSYGRFSAGSMLPDIDRRSIQAKYGTSNGGGGKPSEPGGGAGINWNGNNWAHDCDFIGNDLSNVRIPGEQCGGRCANTDGCTHFAWSRWEGGTCWMKKGRVSKSDAVRKHEDGVVCGVVSEEERNGGSINWNGNNWAHDCDFTGNDLSNVRIPGEQCGGRCANTDRCTHFAWTRWEGGTCWMKKGRVSKSDAVRKHEDGMVCGVVN